MSPDDLPGPTVRQVLIEAAERAVNDLTAEQVQAIVDRAVESSFAKMTTCLPCGLTPEQAAELAHFMGMVKDTGGGGSGAEGYARGVENLRKNIEFVGSWRWICQKTGQIVLALVLTSLGGWVLYLFSSGFREWLKGSIE